MEKKNKNTRHICMTFCSCRCRDLRIKTIWHSTETTSRMIYLFYTINSANHTTFKVIYNFYYFLWSKNTVLQFYNFKSMLDKEVPTFLLCLKNNYYTFQLFHMNFDLYFLYYKFSIYHCL